MWSLIKLKNLVFLLKETCLNVFFNKSRWSERHCILLITIYCENTYHVWFYKVKNIQQEMLLHCLYGERMVNMQAVVTWTAGWVQLVKMLRNWARCLKLRNYRIISAWQSEKEYGIGAFSVLHFFFSTHHPLLAIRSDCCTLPEKLKALI